MRRRLAEARPDHAVLGEEEGLLGPPDAAGPLDPRPDRRHLELRQGRADLGHAHRAEARRRVVVGRGVGAGARPALVGRPRLRAPTPTASRSACPRSTASAERTSPTPASARGLRARAGRAVRRASPSGVWRGAGPGRLLDALPRRRRRVRRRLRARRLASGTWPPCRSSSRRPAAASPTSPASRGPTAASALSRTACSTTRSSPPWPAEPGPCRRSGSAQLSTLLPAGFTRYQMPPKSWPFVSPAVWSPANR